LGRYTFPTAQNDSIKRGRKKRSRRIPERSEVPASKLSKAKGIGSEESTKRKLHLRKVKAMGMNYYTNHPVARLTGSPKRDRAAALAIRRICGRVGSRSKKRVRGKEGAKNNPLPTSTKTSRNASRSLTGPYADIAGEKKFTTRLEKTSGKLTQKKTERENKTRDQTFS